jgi:hypothetical protein
MQPLIAKAAMHEDFVRVARLLIDAVRTELLLIN